MRRAFVFSCQRAARYIRYDSHKGETGIQAPNGPNEPKSEVQECVKSLEWEAMARDSAT